MRNVLLGTFLSLTGIFFSVASVGIGGHPGTASVADASDAPVLTAEAVRQAIEERQALLTRVVTVTLSDPAAGPVSEWKVALAEHPSWVVFRMEGAARKTGIDTASVKKELENSPPPGITEPQSCSVTKHVVDAQGVERVETDCIAKSGYRVHTDELAARIAAALLSGDEALTFAVIRTPGTLTDSSVSEEPMTLLSVGRSNFKGSAPGRKGNVRKALNEKEHNVLIPAGATFSFNQTLGEVSVSKGWYMALTIFEGQNLRPAPGGGVCQASTTVFRAAMNAGLPIVAQKNHSLYVTYYEAYGVGLDATVFPGSQDLAFVNDTGAPIVMQSYADGDEAYVLLFGRDDGRKVALSGPYLHDDSEALGSTVRRNDIVWTRSVTKAGVTTDDTFTARYKSTPKSLVHRWEPTSVITREGGQALLAVR